MTRERERGNEILNKGSDISFLSGGIATIALLLWKDTIVFRTNKKCEKERLDLNTFSLILYESRIKPNRVIIGDALNLIFYWADLNKDKYRVTHLLAKWVPVAM